MIFNGVYCLETAGEKKTKWQKPGLVDQKQQQEHKKISSESSACVGEGWVHNWTNG